MDSFNLLHEPWLPIRRRSGRTDYVAPWQLTEPDDPPVALAAPRADFNGALAQFWIGLLQTAFAPTSSEHWEELFEAPPGPDRLREAFAPYASAFELTADGPRFMQDINSLPDAPEVEIASLLIEMPGGNTLKNNADHFVKRGGVTGLCPSCAASALFTLQINAPSGGVGHRTGLRGGGPLTTLLLADPNSPGGLDTTLWHDLWLNVLPSGERLTGNVGKADQADIFPWLGETRTSEKGSGWETTPEDTHPHQMYWSMPRRIRLQTTDLESGACGVCGRASEELITTYRTKNYGVNYFGAWQHPLSPYYVDTNGQILPLHAQPGGISYRHWLTLGYLEDSGPGGTLRAQNVKTCLRENRLLTGEQLRLWSFGYDMANMKARCWYEAVMPLYLLPANRQQAFIADVDCMVAAGNKVAQTLRMCIRDAWFDAGSEVRGDMSFIPEMFYERTESDFYRLLQSLAGEDPAGVELRLRWLKVIQKAALAIFDAQAASDSFSYGNPKRVAVAHARLNRYLNGKSLREELNLGDAREVA
ncbi:MAG TPA: type I-E CRISPR-associated protein Cse1/CasA [Gammaproteobacteria bacterium]|nr:type I-E CRISPR-associated protein Cse1/CasA [Gammaproteobacteria bacterium]